MYNIEYKLSVHDFDPVCMIKPLMSTGTYIHYHVDQLKSNFERNNLLNNQLKYTKLNNCKNGKLGTQRKLLGMCLIRCVAVTVIRHST
jgi:hypothetical protein